MTFLTLLQSASSPAPSTPADTHDFVLPIYERGHRKKKPRAQKRVKKAQKESKKQIPLITSEKLTEIAQAVAPKLPDTPMKTGEFLAIVRQALHENKVFSELKDLSEFIMADMLLMAQIEHITRQIKIELLKKVAQEQEMEQLIMKLITEDII